MNQVLFGFIRHALTIVGGVLAHKGYIDASSADAIVGGIAAGIGLIWSASKNSRQ